MSEIFGGQLQQRDRIARVARLMGYSPGHPDSWPTEAIIDLLHHCEDRAERELLDNISAMMRQR